jgi:glycosyltransferase involved in cell wall biosynthesis
MKNVVIRAPLLSKSGYGVHSRQVFKFLLTRPNLNVVTQVVPWGITPWNVSEDGFNHLSGEATRRSATSSNQKFDISFQVQLPNEWDASLASFNVGVTAGVETDKCNPMWTSVHCEKMDLVIVPSLHTKKTLETSATCKTPIVVVPEHYFSELEEPSDPLDMNLGTDFNFLTIGVLTGMTPPTDRKNLFYLIKWFVEEFREDDDVGLIIKTNRGRETSIDRQLTESILKKVALEVGHQGVPKIYLLHGDMSRRDMNSLYRHPTIKALVSPTRGEGFGLPHLEAAVTGLPVIATNWSAHTEFLNRGKWIKLDYDLVEIDESRRDNNIFMAGSRWADVQEASFKRSVRKFRKSHSVPKKWAHDLSKILRKTHSEKATFEKYESVLGEILA